MEISEEARKSMFQILSSVDVESELGQHVKCCKSKLNCNALPKTIPPNLLKKLNQSKKDESDSAVIFDLNTFNAFDKTFFSKKLYN